MKKFAIAAAAACIAFGAHANQAPVSWGITGNGNTSASESAGVSTLQWTDTGFSGGWTVSAVAPTAGDYAFNWDLSGLFSWYEVSVGMTTSDGATLVSAYSPGCCTMPSNGFDYSGTYTFDNVAAGQTLSFNITGSNDDSSQILNGQLQLSAVPEPSSIALSLAGLALVGTMVRRRRQA